MQDLEFKQITIVGVGLLGGSIGLALRGVGFTGPIVGVGRREATLQKAVDAGCIDRGVTDLAGGVAGSDLILLCPPVGLIGGMLEQLAQTAPAGAVITDVGSTKKTIVETAERVLGDPGRFIGSHPMAGGECHGPEAARADLLTDKPVILTPTDRTRPDTVDRVERLWRVLGMRVHRMSAERHDRTVARVSHLPHAAAVLLVELSGRDGGLDLASTGFADTTRVASGDPELWVDIFLNNRGEMVEALDEWAALVDRFRTLVAEGRRDELLELLKFAQRTRNDWLHGFQNGGPTRRSGRDRRGKNGI